MRAYARVQRLKPGVSLHRCPPCMHNRWVCPPEFSDGVSVPGQLDLGIPHLCFPCVGIISGSPHPPSIYRDSEDPNAGPHVCMASIITTELPPEPQ